MEAKLDLGTHGSGVSHGGFGRSLLQECLDRLNQARVDAPAPCQSGVESEDSSNPPQFTDKLHGPQFIHDIGPRCLTRTSSRVFVRNRNFWVIRPLR